MDTGEMERIVGQAVRTLIEGQLRGPRPMDTTRVPLRLRGADDAALLLSWFTKLCADDEWRQRFLSGQLQLSIELAPTGGAAAGMEGKASAGAAAIVPVETSRHAVVLEENVVTEAVLRRHAKRDDVIALPARAVVTPSARDYARAAGIRMERGS